MIEFQPPILPEEVAGYDDAVKRVFLAGSIDMDKAERWQEKIVNELKSFDVYIQNPRRSNWNSEIEQDINSPEFAAQVNWELSCLENSDLIVFYFDPISLSPVSMLELGIFSSYPNVVVFCPDGFWRKGNIDIVCERYAIPQVKTWDDLITYIKTHKSTRIIRA